MVEFVVALSISLVLVAIALITAKWHFFEGIIKPALYLAGGVMWGAFGLLTFHIFGVFKPLTLEEVLERSPMVILWSKLSQPEVWALFFFFAAVVFGFMALVSKWAEEADLAGGAIFAALISLSIATIFAIGFFKFFEGIALILGIIATIIGIFVGIMKLRKG